MRVLAVATLSSLYQRQRKRPSHRTSGCASKVLISREVPLRRYGLSQDPRLLGIRRSPQKPFERIARLARGDRPWSGVATWGALWQGRMAENAAKGSRTRAYTGNFTTRRHNRRNVHQS